MAAARGAEIAASAPFSSLSLLCADSKTHFVYYVCCLFACLVLFPCGVEIRTVFCQKAEIFTSTQVAGLTRHFLLGV